MTLFIRLFEWYGGICFWPIRSRPGKCQIHGDQAAPQHYMTFSSRVAPQGLIHWLVVWWKDCCCLWYLSACWFKSEACSKTSTLSRKMFWTKAQMFESWLPNACGVLQMYVMIFRSYSLIFPNVQNTVKASLLKFYWSINTNICYVFDFLA